MHVYSYRKEWKIKNYRLIFTPIRELSSLKALTKRSLIPYMLKLQL